MLQGNHLQWTQKDCDEAFHRRMYTWCTENVPTTNDNVPRAAENATTTADENSLKDIREMYKQILDKIYAFCTKITDGMISREEIQDIWLEGLTIVKMSYDWFYISDPMLKCRGASDIYFTVVRKFGKYSFREKSPSYCGEKCASRIGDPFD